MSEEGEITLILMNGTAYVWKSDDWLKIQKHRIVGNLIGILAALPRQDLFYGLPLALLPEETTLLLEKKIANIKEISKISQPPDKEVQDRYKKFRQENLTAQVEIFKSKRKEEIKDRIDLIVEGKKAKRKIESDLGDSVEIQLDKNKILEEEFEKIKAPNESCLGIQIFTSDPWIQEKDYIPCTWNYPSNEDEKLHYYTYRDLWERGFYVTAGGKFGADFLAYPGDPNKFHAHFVVICTKSRTSIKPREIVAKGRLGNSVRKTIAFSYLSARIDITSEASGFSNLTYGLKCTCGSNHNRILNTHYLRGYGDPVVIQIRLLAVNEF